MISEALCDTEDWINGYWQFNFAITKIYYTFECIRIENFNNTWLFVL